MIRVSPPMVVLANLVVIAIAFGLGLGAASLLRVPPPTEGAALVPDQVPSPAVRANILVTDPSTAGETLALIETYDGGRIGVGNRWRMESALYRLPPEQLSSVFEAIKDGPAKNDTEVLLALFSRWAEVDPLAAMGAAQTLTDLQKRRWMAHKVLGLWAADDPDTAFAKALEVAPDLNQGGIYDSLWRGLAEYEPRDALDRASAVADATERLKRGNEALRIYAYREPENALGWAWINRSESEQIEAVATVVDSWASVDPEAAMDTILDLPARFQTRETFRRIGDSLGHVRLSTSETALEMWERSPAEHRDTLLAAAAEGYAHYNPDAAAKLASHLRDVSLQAGAFYDIARSWAKKDPVSASEWLSGLPDGRPRDRAVDQFAKVLGDSDPAAAAEWALSIGSTATRALRIAEIVRSWLANDSGVALRWIDGAALTPEEHQILLRSQK